MARRQAQMSMPPVQYSVSRLGGGITKNGVSYPGGLDLTTPSLALQPGAIRDGINFECLQSGGYGRIVGYERFDGHPKPSDATYQLIQFSTFTTVPAVGDSLNQATSLATGTVIAVNNASGAYYVCLTKVTGTFDTTHVVSDGSNTVGTPVTRTISLTAKQDAQYTALAADNYRADISAVPGSGAILGVVGMNYNGTDVQYAFRNSTDGTQANLYRASSSGWTLINLNNIVYWTGGTGLAAQPAEGGTLTQGSITATIKRVIWQTGSWAVSGGTATGAFVIDAPTGGNFASGSATTSDGATITLSGAQSAITLSPGGHYEMVKANFSGQSVTRRIYGCDGVNNAFELDPNGDIYAPIKTGASPDTPKHITFHKNFLFLSIDSSLLYSGPGLPYQWTSTSGAGEIATGDRVTGFITLPGSQTTATLAVFMRANTGFLYGTDTTTFNLTIFNTGLGALDYSVQNLFDTFFFDDIGMVTLRTTFNWGNFLPSNLTRNILPFIEQERTKLSASTIMRSKSQYRVFFSDGYGLFLTMINGQYLGVSEVLFPNPVWCCDESEDSSGVERLYFGSNDGNGYVYEMERGTSFDGANLYAYATLAWNPIGSPRILKRFRAASIEMQGNGYAEVQFGYRLGYGSQNIGQPPNVTYPSQFTAAPVWDSFTWDQFIWDGVTLAPTDVDVTGTAENIQVTLASTGNYIPAYQINSVIYHYSMRRGMRV
ncbi:MAG: hypothetical protein ACP5QR_14450 [Rhizomicrobium sp.]